MKPTIEVSTGTTVQDWTVSVIVETKKDTPTVTVNLEMKDISVTPETDANEDTLEIETISDVPKTGDNASMMLYLILIFVSLGGVCYTVARRKYQR